MLNFNYTLDNELVVQPGQLASGIQTQAFQLALGRLTQRFKQTMALLGQKTPTGAPAAAGLSPAWRLRLKTESDFIRMIPARLQHIAQLLVQRGAANAVTQGMVDQSWNTWAPLALKTYVETLRAFEQDVSKAMGNRPIQGMPAVYDKMAKVARVDSPRVPNVEPLGGYTSDDAAYLAAFEPAQANPLWLLVGAAALGLWWTSGGGMIPFLGGYDDFLDFV